MSVDLIARTSVILLAAWSVAALLRRAAPSTRHFVWHMAIVVVLLAPAIKALAPAIPVPRVALVPQVPQVLQAVAQVPQVPLVPAVERTLRVDRTAGTPGTFGTIGTLGTVLTLAWFLFCWLLSGMSVWRGSKPAPESWVTEARALARRLGVNGDVRVRQLHRESSPHIAGLFESVVMMPPSASAWTVEARQAALVHELTHIKRRDRRTQAFAQLACAIYWFNPLVWYAAAGLARERERACDDAVLRYGAKPSDYASLLLNLARSTRTWTPATALSMARPSALEGRLLSILADAVRIPRRSTRWLVGAGIISLTTAILGAHAPESVVLPTVPAAKPRQLVTPQMVMAMDEQSSSAVTGALVDALKDPDRGVREQAALGLAVTPGPDVIEPLLAALNDPDSQVREKAAIGLAFRRDPRIVEPLLAAIEDSDSQVREKAAIALGASGDERAIPALTKATRDPDSQVREKAIAGLILLGRR